MAKKFKEFRIQKRFELWVETKVKAETIEEALAMSKKMDEDDFIEVLEDAELLDCTHLDGTTIGETW